MAMLSADRWITSTLKNDTALAAIFGTRVYQEEAPAGTAYPLITYSQFSPSEPITVVGASILWYDEYWQIALHDRGRNYGTLETGAARAVDLLHSGSTADIVSAEFLGMLRLPSNEPDGEYRTLVLEFRISVKK